MLDTQNKNFRYIKNLKQQKNLLKTQNKILSFIRTFNIYKPNMNKI